MNTDPISDFLTRIRNAQSAGHKVVTIPASILKKNITEILFDQGFILSYKFEEEAGRAFIKIALKYDNDSRQPVIKKLERISKPGLRKYVGVDEMPKVLNGLGIAILSTSKGVMTGKKARKENIGGEVLCYVY